MVPEVTGQQKKIKNKMVVLLSYQLYGLIIFFHVEKEDFKIGFMNTYTNMGCMLF